MTIIDVARAASVSRSTVSLVLNNSPLVKQETREHVLRIIRELGYVPDNNARGLSRKTANSLGVIIMAEENPQDGYGFDQHTGMCSYNISLGIMDGLLDTDYGIITEHFCSIANPHELPKSIRNRRVDGAFIVGSPYSPELFEQLKTCGIPIVAVGVNSNVDGFDSVFSDPGAGVKMGVEYLLQTGHRKLCLLNSPQTFRSYEVRCEAVRQLEQNGLLQFNWDWMLSCTQNNGLGGYQAFKAFWEAGNRPDAMIAANANLALGAMRYLYEQHIRLPDAMSIVAYEDSSLSGYAIPPLTTVDIHKEEIGRRAATCLLERIRNPKKEIEKIVIPSNMVLRESVALRRNY